MSAPSPADRLALVAADPAAPRRQCRSQGRKPGGQPGHAGTTRLQSEQVDIHEHSWPE